MLLIATAAALAMAAVLLGAAVEKARNPAALAGTIASLGFPSSLARPAALGVIAAEITVAIAILFRPDTVAAQGGIAALAGLFAVAGVQAMRRDEPIRCHCFGAGEGALGITQVIAVIPWLLGAGVVHAWFAEAPPMGMGASLFAPTALGIAAIRGVTVLKAWRGARDDRRSAQEMYIWLPSH